MEFHLPIRLHTWAGSAVSLPIWLALQVHVETSMAFIGLQGRRRGSWAVDALLGINRELHNAEKIPVGVL
jgi:hypothetical protein